MWAQVLSASLGLWLMAAPAVLGYDGAADTNSRIAGPIIATFATIAIWEATRGTRWVNVVAGLWLLIAPWVLGYDEQTTQLNDRIVGVLLLLFSLVKGKISQQFGGGWISLFKRDPIHVRLSSTPESTHSKAQRAS